MMVFAETYRNQCKNAGEDSDKCFGYVGGNTCEDCIRVPVVGECSLYEVGGVFKHELGRIDDLEAFESSDFEAKALAVGGNKTWPN